MGVTRLSCSSQGIKFETTGCLEIPVASSCGVPGCRWEDPCHVEGAMNGGPHPCPPPTRPLQGPSYMGKLALGLQLFVIVKNHLEHRLQDRLFKPSLSQNYDCVTKGARDPPWV